MLELYLLATLVIILSVLYYYFTRNFNYWKSRNVQGPKPIVFFGNLIESTLRRKNIGIVFKEFYDNYPTEKVVGIYRMTTPCLVLRDLDIIKQILIKDFDYFEDRGIEFSKEGLGVNLFHADGETWRVLRNKFTPLFTSGKLKNMLYLMTERGDKFVEHVQEMCEQCSEQEVHSLMQKFTISTISACAFGLDIDTLGDKIEVLRRIDKLVFKMNIFFELDMMYPGLLKYVNASLFPAEVTDFFENLAKTVISQRNGVPSNAKDFMDLILELKQKKTVSATKKHEDDQQLSLELTDSIIAAQAFVFYVAGYETSATTLSFLLYEMAKNPDIQDKLCEEIHEVLKKHKNEVTYEALMDMTYMQQVIDETLRLYPLVEPLQRSAKVNYQIPGTNYTVTKGQLVFISPIGIHRDPQYYPDPEKFDPERFTPELIKSRHPCAYIPFGTGPRNCIGMRFAKVQSKVCLTKFLAKFRVSPSEKTPKVMKFCPERVIIGPHNGIILNVSPRKI